MDAEGYRVVERALRRLAVSHPAFWQVVCGSLVALLPLFVACSRSSRVPGVATAVATDVHAAHAMPVGVRRLTVREFRKLASELLQTDVPLAFEQRLPPDVRQDDGYTRNLEQTMSGALLVRLEREVPSLVADALGKTPALFACRSGDASCVRRWIEDKRRAAFRRPVTPDEVELSLELFRRAAAGNSDRDGAELVLTELLISPRLWYATELGEEDSSGPPLVRLAQHEIADQIALVVRGTVADDELVTAADAGKLGEAEVRQWHARRLLAKTDTREHYREFVAAWLEVDDLTSTSKSEEVFERYEAFKPHMLAETERFTDEVFVSGGASVNSLLNSKFASVDPQMAVFYGMKAFGSRAESASVGRVGVLQHASFLASHAHADTTSPVLRGDFVLRKVLCHRLPRPSELDIEVFMPRPSHEMTRREQFARHSADPRCAECHDQIDGFGLVFEEFDAAGRRRAAELGRPVRTDGHVAYAGGGYAFTDSKALSNWLTSREETTQCFARQLFRFVTGRVEPNAEEEFLSLRQRLGAAQRDNVLEHLVTYVGSETFVLRKGETR